MTNEDECPDCGADKKKWAFRFNDSETGDTIFECLICGELIRVLAGSD